MKCPKCNHENDFEELIKYNLQQLAVGHHLMVFDVLCCGCHQVFTIKALLLEVT